MTMGFIINISDVEMEGESSLLNGLTVTGNEDSTINIRKIKISEKAKLLNDAQIHNITEEAENRLRKENIDSKECQELRKILEEIKKSETEKKRQLIMEHICNFTGGILGSIVSGMIL